MFKRGDIVIYRGRLWKVTGDYRLNGTVKLKGLNGEGYTYARFKSLRLATSLMKELI